MERKLHVILPQLLNSWVFRSCTTPTWNCTAMLSIPNILKPRPRKFSGTVVITQSITQRNTSSITNLIKSQARSAYCHTTRTPYVLRRKDSRSAMGYVFSCKGHVDRLKKISDWFSIMHIVTPFSRKDAFFDDTLLTQGRIPGSQWWMHGLSSNCESIIRRSAIDSTMEVLGFLD